MVRVWYSHASSHSSDVLVVAEFPTAKDAMWAVEVVQNWVDDPFSRKEFDKDFEDPLVYHEGKTAISCFYSQSEEAVDHVCDLLKKDGALEIRKAWSPWFLSISVEGATMKEVESKLSSFPSSCKGVFDSQKYIRGNSCWRLRAGGRYVYTTSGFLLEENLRLSDSDDNASGREQPEGVLGAEVSELRKLGCSIRMFRDCSQLLERQRLSLYFVKTCESQQQAEAFLQMVRDKLVYLFGLDSNSRELPNKVEFNRNVARVVGQKFLNVSLEKEGHMIYEKGLIGDILSGSAEKASSVSEQLHCELDVSYSGERWVEKRRFQVYQDGKLVRDQVPSEVNLVAPLALQFQEVMAQLEKKGLSKEETREAMRIFLEMAAKKRFEWYDF
ncbi:MAG TPA: hypothetical protein VKF15_00780 [Nitrososphaerales archaeon]|nr:hypothetical protein [Nitrososphaerales archaeon]